MEALHSSEGTRLFADAGGRILHLAPSCTAKLTNWLPATSTTSLAHGKPSLLQAWCKQEFRRDCKVVTLLLKDFH
jgi:hypothetical protein